MSDRPDAEVNLVARPEVYVSVAVRPWASAIDVSAYWPVTPVGEVNV